MMSRETFVRALACTVGVLTVTGFAVAVAFAAVPAAVWSVTSRAYPTDFTAADNARCESEPPIYQFRVCDGYAVSAVDAGAKSMGEKTIVLEDTVPAGLTVRQPAVLWFGKGGSGEVADLVRESHATCTTAPEGSGTLVKCTIPSTFFASQKEPFRHVQPDGVIQLRVPVTVDEGAVPGALVNHASVSGGGANTGASATSENTVGEGVAPFGFSLMEAQLNGADGSFETQAGGHPYQYRTLLGSNTVFRETPQIESSAAPIEDVRDVIVDLPVGVAGSAVSAPRCTPARLASKGEAASGALTSGCPADSILGYIESFPEGKATARSPIYNLLPDRGYVAELGFLDPTNTTHVLYVSLAPTPAGYVVRTTSREIPQVILDEVMADVFGDPAATTRAQESVEAGGGFKYATNPTDTPTFTNPDYCGGEPLVTTVHMDSWQTPGSYKPDGTPNFNDPHWVSSTTESAPPVSGCEALTGLFNPALTAQPSVTKTDSPTGLDVNLQVPQSTGPETLGTPPVRETVVTLPEGMTVDPSSANGLGACSEAQIGWQGKSATVTGEYENFNAAPPACPDTSRIGTVELETPALPAEACKEAIVPLQECPEPSERVKAPIVGSVYVAQPYANPFGSLLAIYIVVNDQRTGVVVKIPARVEADPATGRLTTTVPDTPQFPFNELRTHFYPGDNAALKTPATCGAYTVESLITPWSAPQSGPPATPQAGFEITQGADGGACVAPGFSPSFVAGTETNKAGGFSPFSVTFARKDGEQGLGGTTVTMPPGVSAILTGVPLCPEPQAVQGTCSEASLIGEATSAVGAGPEPFWVHGGKVYLTGPYAGGPFGLSIVVPTTAGPYTLTGNAGPGKEVVRASIHVDPITAQVTATSDPLPTIIQGIPLDIKTVNVTINRTSFTFNPTSCNPMTATGTITSTIGTSIPVSSRFQASDCTSLGFKPQFKVSSNGKTSRKTGASLRTVLTYPKAVFGSQTNIATVKVSLPKQLPSNLKTLQHACRHQTFEENPAACPNESRVGTATATTLLLPVPLTGPAYFVSYGGAKFPELVIVLQGYGITVDLHGETFIEHKITSSTFHTVPDVPVGTFELNLPQGKYPALAAPTGLCGKKLVMPTIFTAQNGATIKQNTPIAVTNCPKAKHKAKKTTKHKHHK